MVHILTELVQGVTEICTHPVHGPCTSSRL